MNIVFESNFVPDKYTLLNDIEGIKEEYTRYYTALAVKHDSNSHNQLGGGNGGLGYQLQKKVKINEDVSGGGGGNGGDISSDNSNLDDEDSNVPSSVS